MTSSIVSICSCRIVEIASVVCANLGSILSGPSRPSGRHRHTWGETSLNLHSWRLRPFLLLLAALLLIQPSVRAVLADEPGPTTPQFVVGGVAGATLRAAPNGTSNVLATVPPGSIVSQAGADVVDNGVVWRQVRTTDGIVGFLPAGFLVALDTGSTVASAPPNGPPTGPAAAAGAGSSPDQALSGGQTAATAPAASTGPAASAAPTSAAQTVASVPGASQPSSQSVQSDGSQRPSTISAAPPAATASQGSSDPSDPSGTTVASAGASSPSGSSRPLVTNAQQTGQTPVGSPTPTPPAAPSGPSGPPKGVRTTIEHRRGQDVEVTHLDEETAPDGRPAVAGRILVGFKPGTAPAAQQAAHQAAGVRSTSALSTASTVTTASTALQNVSVADVTSGTTAQALAAYRSQPDVAWAEPDYVKRATLIPNDPCFSAATAVCSVPQYGPQKISAPAAWDVTQGSAATRVAILDCGVYTESSTVTSPDGLKGHPDLRGKVVGEINFTTSTHGADDYCDHGTMMAGIAGARTNVSPAIGIAGVGFNVSLLNGKVLDDNGDGSDSGVASGITWATDNGAKVISMSLGGPGPCSNTLQTAVDYAWARNVVIVSAAGNGDTDGVGDPAPESPGNCNHVIAVGATDQNDQRASFSNYGLAVPLAAPGVAILSTDYFGGYRTVSGTSPATPHVAGVAGLLWSTPYGTSNQAIVNRLLATADRITGTGSIWANGRVNAAAAVATVPVVTCSPRPPVTVTTAPATGGRLVTITVSNPGNTIQSVEFLNLNAAATNAQAVTFAGGSTSSLSAAGTLTVMPTSAASQQSFVLKRVAAGQPTTLRFVVHDACGTWTSFVGGGISAGF